MRFDRLASPNMRGTNKYVHPQNVQLHNVQLQNVQLQNVQLQNVQATKRPGYKKSSYQTSSYKTSRIQNVQDTERPVLANLKICWVMRSMGVCRLYVGIG